MASSAARLRWRPGRPGAAVGVEAISDVPSVGAVRSGTVAATRGQQRPLGPAVTTALGGVEQAPLLGGVALEHALGLGVGERGDAVERAHRRLAGVARP